MKGMWRHRVAIIGSEDVGGGGTTKMYTLRELVLHKQLTEELFKVC